MTKVGRVSADPAQADRRGLRRPNPWRWLKYCFGAGVAASSREWVLHDITCPTWVLRQIVRSLVVISPLVLVLLFAVPGPLWIRAVAAVGGTLMSLFFSVGFIVETTEHRLVKAGYPAGTGQQLRDRRAAGSRSAATARRRAKMFDRLERRG